MGCVSTRLDGGSSVCIRRALRTPSESSKGLRSGHSCPLAPPQSIPKIHRPRSIPVTPRQLYGPDRSLRPPLAGGPFSNPPRL
ncbi:hypothetical protein FJTKL_14355 [Diaporthe vaccinii]|uniref:Uncharacterized protein n=1 Tax=Diaporthe vaccinii TaxID=105482 RepID=A0ABR4E8B1_9PEZI